MWIWGVETKSYLQSRSPSVAGRFTALRDVGRSSFSCRYPKTIGSPKKKWKKTDRFHEIILRTHPSQMAWDCTWKGKAQIFWIPNQKTANLGWTFYTSDTQWPSSTKQGSPHLYKKVCRANNMFVRSEKRCQNLKKRVCMIWHLKRSTFRYVQRTDCIGICGLTGRIFLIKEKQRISDCLSIGHLKSIFKH